MARRALHSAFFATTVALLTLAPAHGGTPLISQGPDVYVLTPENFEKHLSLVTCMHLRFSTR